MTTAPEKNLVQARILISGRVQGVNFRWYTQRKAIEFDVTGWVRNLWDGRVEAIFEGKESAVHKAVQWCHVGSPMARVDDVQVTYEIVSSSEFRTFRIK